MNLADPQYLTHLGGLLHNGRPRETRSGMVRSLFGAQIRFDLQQGFPLLTTKKLHTKSIVAELLWFLSGDTNVRRLQEQGVTIWNAWADDNGDLGPIYSQQWRAWQNYPGDPHKQLSTIDQIEAVIEGLRTDPFGRRHIVSAWNVADLDKMALPPCHCLFQFYVRGGTHRSGDDEHHVLFLDCQLYQRSADWLIGVPFNIASYALLTHIVARELAMVPGEFVHTFGDYHLYDNHIDQAREQLQRQPRDLPKLTINPDFEKRIFDLEIGDFAFVDYDPHPAIKAEVAV